MKIFTTTITIIAVSIILGICPGCMQPTGHVQQPGEEQAQMLREGAGAIVLVRLKSPLPERVTSIPRGWMTHQFLVTDMETGSHAMSHPDKIPLWTAGVPGWPSPSESSMDQGWIYLELAAGSYWVKFVPRPSSQSPILTESVELRAFRIDVKEDDGFIYAGTLEMDATLDIHGFVDPQKPLSVELVDETEAAIEVAHEAFEKAGISGMETRLMQPYNRSLEPGEIERLSPVGLATIQSDELTGPDWMTRSMGAALSIPAGLVVAGGGYGPVLLFIPHFWGLVAVSSAGGYIHGLSTEEKWKPVYEDIQQIITQMQPHNLLGNRIIDYLGDHAYPEQIDLGTAQNDPDSTKTVGSLAFCSIYRLDLSPSTKGGISMDLGIRIRLWDVRRQTWAYDQSFLYTELQKDAPMRQLSLVRFGLLRPHERVLQVSSSTYSHEDLSTPEGRQSFCQQIPEAIELALAEFRADIALSPWVIPMAVD